VVASTALPRSGPLKSPSLSEPGLDESSPTGEPARLTSSSKLQKREE